MFIGITHKFRRNEGWSCSVLLNHVLGAWAKVNQSEGCCSLFEFVFLQTDPCEKLTNGFKRASVVPSSQLVVHLPS